VFRCIELRFVEMGFELKKSILSVI